MKKLLILIVVVVLIIIAVKWSKNSGEAGDNNLLDENLMSEKITVTLAAQNNSGEVGTAVLEDRDGKVRVLVALTGAPIDVPQPAHLHAGTCAALDAAPLFPLNSLVNGQSETMLDTTLTALKLSLPLALNVHKSSEELAMFVACGDLK